MYDGKKKIVIGCMNIWPTCKQVDDEIPESFKQKYPESVIIDATEIKVEMPSAWWLKSHTNSNNL